MKAPLAKAHPTLVRSLIVAIIVVWALRDIALLVGYAVLLAYALLPVVRFIERVRLPGGRHMASGIAAALVMVTLVCLAGWLVVLAFPRVAAQAMNLTSNAPEVMARLVQDLHGYAAQLGLSVWLDPAIEDMRAQGPGLAQRLGGSLATGVSAAFGGVGNLLCLTLLPLLAFYLLADANAVRLSSLRFIPEEARAELLHLGGAVDRALRSYVRGQAVVCLVTGTVVGSALALAHHPVALLLAFLVRAAELIPYLGFMVAASAIAFAGSNVGGGQAVLGVVIYVVLNWTIGTFVTPRLMGRYLKMHPFVVTVAVLAGAKLLGPAGALLALPGAAVVQTIISELAPVHHAKDGSRTDDAPPEP